MTVVEMSVSTAFTAATAAAAMATSSSSTVLRTARRSVGLGRWSANQGSRAISTSTVARGGDHLPDYVHAKNMYNLPAVRVQSSCF